jgi:hypothetical protein
MRDKTSESPGLPIFNRLGTIGKRIGGLLYGLVLLAIGGGILWWCGSVISPYAQGVLRVGFAFVRKWLG